MPQPEYGKLLFAQMFATMKHEANHQRYGVLPYTHHLQDVERVLRRFGPTRGNETKGYTDEDLLCAAWLHDVVEDTPTKIREIREAFGGNVALLVDAVTSVPGANRATKAALTLPKTRTAGWAAVRLKLADRIANVENGGDSVDMYKREYAAFRHGLYVMIENADMWYHLDTLMGYVP